MAFLSDLPEEIILYILEQVQPEQTKRDFRALVPLISVNHQFHRLAIPILCRNVTDWADIPYPEIQNLTVLRKLALLLIMDPVKASYVHHVRLDCLVPGDTDLKSNAAEFDGDDRIMMSPEQESHIRNFISQAFENKENTRSRWEDELFSGRLMPIPHLLAVMIFHLPNLKTLIIMETKLQDEGADQIWFCISDLRSGLEDQARASNTPEPLPLLEYVQTGGEAIEYPHGTSPLALIATWPTVKTIVGESLGDGDEVHDADAEQEFLDLKPHSANFTSVILRPASVHLRPGCKLLGEHLLKLLGAAKALECFEYVIGHHSCWIRFWPRELLNALSTQQESLRSIKLQVTDTLFDIELDEEFDWTLLNFGHLRDFTSLERLDVPCPFIFGLGTADTKAAAERMASRLPRKLRHLTINNCCTEMEFEAAAMAMTQLLEVKEQQFPVLSALAIVVYQRQKAVFCGQESKELQARAESQGVVFEALIFDYNGAHGYDYQSFHDEGLETDPSSTDEVVGEKEDDLRDEDGGDNGNS